MRDGLDVLEEKLSKCTVCGTILTYRGLGEYYCPGCDKVFYDEYGTVRNYVESHPGATINEVSATTGVSRAMIRRLIEQDKFVENATRAISG